MKHERVTNTGMNLINTLCVFIYVCELIHYKADLRRVFVVCLIIIKKILIKYSTIEGSKFPITFVLAALGIEVLD